MSTKSFQLTNLLFLMRSICVSLGFTESQEFSKQQQHTLANLEHMRAFSGVYYLVVSFIPIDLFTDVYCTQYLAKIWEFASRSCYFNALVLDTATGK